MKTIFNSKIGSFLTVCAVMMIATVAASAQPNLRVWNWSGPTAAVVKTPYQYSVRVRNMGNMNAAGVKVKIDLPLTNTSPNRYILGKVTGLQTGCSIVAQKIECNLGSIQPSTQRIVTFNYEYPVTSTPLAMTATASTTTPGEINPNNNFATRTQAVDYPSNPINSTVNVLVTNCTGTNLTSFFECELFPSSQQSFTMTMNQGGTLTIPYAGFGGTWSQPTSKQLEFTITDGTDGATFSGYATSSTCFEGLTTFIPVSSYNSAYRVCIQ